MKRTRIVSALGYAGDRTPGAMTALGDLAGAMSAVFAAEIAEFGSHEMVADAPWRDALERARPYLSRTADAVSAALAEAAPPLLLAAPRCAAALASLPPILAAHPGAHLLWIDAHGDAHTPETTRSAYLGGMPFAAMLGAWDSGFGDGLDPAHASHLGGRALEPEETALLDRLGVARFALSDVAAEIPAVVGRVAGAPLVIHLDCDVFPSRWIAAEHDEPGGATPLEIARLFAALAETAPLAALEIAEFSPTSAHARGRSIAALTEAIAPLAQARPAPPAGAPRRR